MGSDKKLSLILGSGSPRRKELLGWLDIPFTTVVPDIDEVSNCSKPCDIAIDITTQKLDATWKLVQDNYAFPFVVCADTMVVLGDKIFGKPKDREDAKQILNELSGKTHEVITSVGIKLKCPIKEKSFSKVFYISTKVTFCKIEDTTLDLYLDSEESLDKAGAYGIQGKGLAFIGKIEGSYSNVVGFPLSDFVDEMKNLFLELGYPIDNWRSLFSL